MRVVCLKQHPSQYSCSSYLILGDWNRIQDVNTLVDGGIDDFILEEISNLSTGVGKKAVEKIVLTHGHFDHCAGTKVVKEKYSCPVLAFSNKDVVDQTVHDGQIMRCGDRDFEVIHIPGHSTDSICLYCPEQEALFSGDTPLFIKTPGGSYEENFVTALEKIARRPISIVYPGHGTPISGKIGEMINNTLHNVYQSHITIL